MQFTQSSVTSEFSGVCGEYHGYFGQFGLDFL